MRVGVGGGSREVVVVEVEEVVGEEVGEEVDEDVGVRDDDGDGDSGDCVGGGRMEML